MAHNQEEILQFLKSADVATVATSAGEKIRSRMMHFAVDNDFNFYLATMKGDPKTQEITRNSSIALMVHSSAEDINASREVEINGSASFLRHPEERKRALELTAEKSPVVKHLVAAGNQELLDCLKVKPDVVKFRIFGEIVQGQPPTVLEFPQNRQVTSDWALLKRKLNSWFMELRSPFFTATLAPILTGTAVAWALAGTFHLGYFLLALLAGLLLHAGTNIMNDYADHRSRNDELNREFVRPFSGGSRTIQLGLLSPMEVLAQSLLYFTAASILGIYLAWTRGPLILLLGIIALLSGIFYTARPFNWVSRGIGEAVVGLNFGPLMTLGAYYVQTQTFSWTPLIAGIPIGFLIALVLYINEFPDYQADKAVGKRTWVVRLGRERAVGGYILATAAVYAAVLAGIITKVMPLSSLVALVLIPLSLRAIQFARKHHSSSFELAPANALTIIVHLGTGLLLTWAYLWAGFGAQKAGYLIAGGILVVAFLAFMYLGVEKQVKAASNLRESLKGSA